MNSISNIQIRRYVREFESKPGYILDFTRQTFEDLVYDTIGVDISDMPESNSRRLKHVLTTCKDEQVDKLILALRA